MASLDDRKGGLDFAFLNGTVTAMDGLNSKENVNPLVYQLVRVERDGTLVPATDDEVEHLLDGERFKKALRNRKETNHLEYSPSSDSFLEDGDVTGLSDPEDAKEEKRKRVAKLEFIAAMLQKVNEEERMKIKTAIQGSTRYRTNRPFRNKSNWTCSHESPDSVSHVLSADAPSQESPSPINSAPVEEQAIAEMNNFFDTCTTQPEAITKPEPSPIKRDVCLDNLCIRELHEAFRKTFGRETSVKDKQWLKRRISMGLLKSNDVSNVVNEVKRDSLENQENIFTKENSYTEQSTHSLAHIQPIRSVVPTNILESSGVKQSFGNCNSNVPHRDFEGYGNGSDDEFVDDGIGGEKRMQKPSMACEYEEDLNRRVTGKAYRTVSTDYDSDEVYDREKIARKRMRNAHIEYEDYEENFHLERTADKRVRKPTRRYIEEVPEEDPKVFSGMTLAAVKDSGHGLSPQKSRVTPYFGGNEGMPLVTRQDSIGGSGIQVPIVSRVRRGRPRKNCTSLMRYNPNGMAAKLVKKALSAHTTHYDDVVDSRWSPIDEAETIDEIVDEDNQLDENMLLPVTEGSLSDPFDYELEDDNSDDYVATVPTSKGGTRRKHHRAWTLGEVMKLVEGVARCGAGRWSEIKRLSFSSHGHRTSVDLKDKWRNLLRASYSQLQSSREGRSQRKHAAVPIPSQILARVRELSTMQSRALGSNPSSLSRSGRTVHKKSPV